MKLETAATITIKSPGAMTAKGRRAIAGWMRRQAANLVNHKRKYVTTGNFTARWRHSP